MRLPLSAVLALAALSSPTLAEERGSLMPYLGVGWQGAATDGRVLIGLGPDGLSQGRLTLKPDPGTQFPPALRFHREHEAGGMEDSRIVPAFSLIFTYRF